MVHTPLALPLSGPEVVCSPRQHIIYNPKPLLPWPSNLKVATLYPGTTDWGNTPGMDYTSRSLTVQYLEYRLLALLFYQFLTGSRGCEGLFLSILHSFLTLYGLTEVLLFDCLWATNPRLTHAQVLKAGNSRREKRILNIEQIFTAAQPSSLAEVLSQDTCRRFVSPSLKSIAIYFFLHFLHFLK